MQGSGARDSGELGEELLEQSATLGRPAPADRELAECCEPCAIGERELLESAQSRPVIGWARSGVSLAACETSTAPEIPTAEPWLVN